MSPISKAVWYSYFLFGCWIFFACQETKKEVSYQNALALISEMDSSALMTEVASFLEQVEQEYAQRLANQRELPAIIENDWLDLHPEKGQHFLIFAQDYSPYPSFDSTLYLLPLGTFTEKQQVIFHELQKYLHRFYPINIEQLPSMAVEQLPDSLKRWKKADIQVHSSNLLDYFSSVTTLPNKFALLIITTSDLYPDERLPYVFGQASSHQKAAVISLNRLGNSAYARGYRQSIARSKKLATHELGHALGMKHCIYFSCNMNGSNHLKELDRQIPNLCADCWLKLKWKVREISP